MTALALHLLRQDGGTQPRAALREDWIAEYAADMVSGAVFPPVVVFYDGQDYWLADGFHRAGAAKAASRTEIEADVRQGTCRDAILFSVSANGQHGQRRTNEDKRRAVLVLLSDDEWSAWSDSEVARRCAVSQPFVGTLRPKTYNDYKSDQRTYVHPKSGKPVAMDTSRIGRTKALRREAEAAATAAVSGHVFNAALSGEPATMEGLRGAVKDAVIATVGPKTKREPVVYDPPKSDEVEDPWPHVAMDFVAFVKGVAETAFNPDGYVPTKPKVRAIYLRQAQEAAVKLNHWIALLEEVNAQAAA